MPAPLPVLAFYSNIAVNDVRAMVLRLGWRSMSYRGYEGEFATLGLDVAYQPTRHVGIGFGRRNLGLDTNYESDGAFTGVRVDLQGPAASMTIRV